MKTLVKSAQRFLKSSGARFGSDRRGNFAVIFALLSPALILSAGLMVDTSRLYSAQTKLNAAIDAAVLATTQDLTLGRIAEEDAQEAIERWVFSNVEGTTLVGLPVTIDGIDIDKVDKTVAIDASVTVPLTLMQLTAGETKQVSAYTKASYSNTKIEVAMALDVTGSMRGSKIRSLKKAAKKAVDVLIPDANAAERVRIGLVPYSSTVNAAPVLSKIEVNGATDGCVYERTGDDEFTDAFADRDAPLSGTRNTNVCVNSEIMEMTNNRRDLKRHINSFRTGGWTAGHLGISWVHYMLSPKWNAAWGFSADVASYGDAQTQKFAIVMTDGVFNTYLSAGPAGSQSGKSNDAARRLCSSMKDKTVKVYTIAFQAPAQASQLMQDCANEASGSSQYFYNASSEAELIEAFEEIAKDIEGLQLIN